MARSAHLAGRDQLDSIGHPKTWSPDRIRHPGCVILASSARRREFAYEDVALVHRGLVCVRNFCGQRRISSILCPFAHSLTTRCLNRHLWRFDWDCPLSNVFATPIDKKLIRENSLRRGCRSQAREARAMLNPNRKSQIENEMGLTGLEPVTLRLSSACSNQLSYRPAAARSAQGK
jgi:hypothetical protein